MTFLPPPKYLCWILYVMLFLFLGGKYHFDSSQIQEANERQMVWDDGAKAAGSLARLSEEYSRFLRGQQTLEGWRISRYPWSEVLLSIKAGLPGDLQKIQLNRLQFDEEIEGLRKSIPGERVAMFYPLKRKVKISLSGVIQTDRSQSMFQEFQRNMQDPYSENVSVASMSLVNSSLLLNKYREPTDLTRFSFLINLSPHELRP